METKTKAIVAVVVLLTAFAAGRFTVPVQVKVEKEIVTVEVEKKTTDTQKNERRVETEETRPDGTKIRKVVTDIATDTHHRVDTIDTSSSKESKVVDSRSRLTASILAGANVTDLTQPPVFGAHISKPFLGPITLGVWGLTSKVGGVSVGLQF